MKLREHIATFRRGFLLLRQYDRVYFRLLISRVILSAALPYIPIYFSAALVDALTAVTVGQGNVRTLVLYAGLTVGLTFLGSLVNTWLSVWEGQRQTVLYRAENWQFSEKAMELSYGTIEERETALLRERIRIDSQTGYNLFYQIRCTREALDGLIRMLLSLSLCITFFLLPGIPPWQKWLIPLFLLLDMVGLTWQVRKVRREYDTLTENTIEANMRAGKYNEYVDDYGTGKDIRMYAMGNRIAEEMKHIEYQFHREYARFFTKQMYRDTPYYLFRGITRASLYGIFLTAAINGHITIGSVTRYASCLLLFQNAASELVNAVLFAVNNNLYLKRYFSYFDISNPMYKGSLTVEKRDDREYEVEFRNVSFRYPGSENWALRHVNLRFRVGKKLAVVGMNGSGKTTFIKLLCRLYDPTEGEILLNGVDIRKYDYDEYMSIFSVVFQDFKLFSFSLGQNVAASPVYDKERAKDCLRAAGFGERLDTLERGLDTCLYKDYDGDGVEISGGEAQKIALARALYKDAPFIILDEPTSALDPVAEYEVYSRFSTLVGDRTAIYISHRLASCRFCDTIAVFDNGTVVQQGSHGGLVGERGKYQELWTAQAQYYGES